MTSPKPTKEAVSLYTMDERGNWALLDTIESLSTLGEWASSSDNVTKVQDKELLVSWSGRTKAVVGKAPVFLVGKKPQSLSEMILGLSVALERAMVVSLVLQGLGASLLESLATQIPSLLEGLRVGPTRVRVAIQQSSDGDFEVCWESWSEHGRELLIPVLIHQHASNELWEDLSSVPGAGDALRRMAAKRACQYGGPICNINNLEELKSSLEAIEGEHDAMHVLLFWAGHGVSSVGTQNRLVTATGRVEEGIGIVELVEAVLDVFWSVQSVTIVLDVCHGGAFAEDLKGALEDRTLPVNGLRLVGSSGKWEEAGDTDGFLSEVVGSVWKRGVGREWSLVMEELARLSGGWSRFHGDGSGGRQKGFSWLWKAGSGLMKIGAFEQLSGKAQAFIEKKGTGFVGREWLFERTKAWQEALTGKCMLLVVGQPGIGKSSWTAEFVKRGLAGSFHFCRYDVVESLRGSVFVKDVVGRLQASLGWDRLPDCPELDRVSSPESPVVDLEDYMRALGRHLPSRVERVIVIVDSLDEALTGDGGVLACVRVLVENSPAWMKVIATSRNDAAVLEALEVFEAEKIDAGGDQNLEDLREWVGRQPGLSEEQVEAIVNASGGNFLYAKMFVEDGGIESGVRLPSGLPSAYEQRAKRRWTNVDDLVGGIMPVFRVLCAVREPLPVSMLEAACRESGMKEEYALDGVLAELGSVVDSDGRTVRLFHKSFSDWLTTNGWKVGARVFRVGDNGVVEGHKALWRASVEAWRETQDEYAVRHGVAHGMSGGVKREELVKDLVADAAWAVCRGSESLPGLRADVLAVGEPGEVAEQMTKSEGCNATDLHNVGVMFWRLNMADGAEKLYLASMEAYKETRGTGSTFYASSLNDLALVYESQSKLDEARKFFREALDIYEKCVGKEHGYALSLNNLGLLAKKQGELDEARSMFQEAMAICEETGETHGQGYVLALNNLANLAAESGDLEEAKTMYEQVLRYHDESGSRGSEAHGNSYCYLASLHVKQQDWVQAESAYEEALAIYERSVGRESNAYGLACCNSAIVAKELGKSDQAEVLYIAALDAYRVALGKDDETFATVLNNLADVWCIERKRLEEARGLVEEALEIQAAFGGRKSENGTIFLSTLAEISEAEGDLDGAIAGYEEVIRLRKELGLSCDDFSGQLAKWREERMKS